MSPVRLRADNISFQVLPVCNPSPSQLRELEKVMSQKIMFELVSIESAFPQDPCKKFEYFKRVIVSSHSQTHLLTC